MTEDMTLRIVTALESIAESLATIAERPERRQRPAASKAISNFDEHLERLIQHSAELTGRLTMEQILEIIGLADQDDRGTRLSVGVALSRIGVRKVRSASARFYEFANPEQTAF